MDKDLQDLIIQIDNARKDPRLIDRDKANNYYNALINLKQQLKKKDEVIEKAKKYIQENCYKHYDSYNDQQFYILEDKNDLLQILEDKEVE